MNVKSLLIAITLMASNFSLIYSQENSMNTLKITKEFGAYDIPADWIEVDKFPGLAWNFWYSQKDENSEAPDWTHISVSFSRNPFKIDENEKFKEAILGQLLRQFMQADPTQKPEITNFAETTTKQNYLLFIFTIRHYEIKLDKKVTSIQYYIVGDEKHTVLYLTAFDEEKILPAIEAAEIITNSFEWEDY
jgi:hypothetical protein